MKDVVARAIGRREAKVLLHAPREGAPPVPKDQLAAALRADGVALVERVVSPSVASVLLNQINTRLSAEVHRCHDAAPRVREPLLGDILCKQGRYDLKLDLSVHPVCEALEAVVQAVGVQVASVLGPHPDLWELGALIADDGAQQQPVHPDTPWSRAATVVTCTVALQDVLSPAMGPTIYLPRTHTDRSRSAEWGVASMGDDDSDDSYAGKGGEGDRDDQDDEAAETLAASVVRTPLPSCTDAVIFDARCLHCGSANTSGRRRVLFYCSFRRRAGLLFGQATWQGRGFDQPGTLLNELRGAYRLSRDGARLEHAHAPSTSSPAWHLGWHMMGRHVALLAALMSARLAAMWWSIGSAVVAALAVAPSFQTVCGRFSLLWLPPVWRLPSRCGVATASQTTASQAELRPAGRQLRHLTVLETPGSRSRMERVALREGWLPEELCRRVVAFLEGADAARAPPPPPPPLPPPPPTTTTMQPSDTHGDADGDAGLGGGLWAEARHAQHATVDIEVEPFGPLGWLEKELDERGLVDTLLSDLARLYRVERAHLVLREMFVVRYEHPGAAWPERGGVPEQEGAPPPPRAQPGLEMHRDASWFSFVASLSRPGIDFTGGGTVFAARAHGGARPHACPRGACLLFVGQRLHGAAPVTSGVRLVLTGFVDYRAPLSARNACTAQMLKFDADFVCSSCKEFARPYLRSNVRMLSKAGRGKAGRGLLELLASRRLRLPDLDLEDIEHGSRQYLAAGRLDDVTCSAAARKFVTTVLSWREG